MENGKNTRIESPSLGRTGEAYWIWYPGDFEVWLGNQFNNRRTERGAMFPPFWKQDSHWPTVAFSTVVTLTEEETIHIHAEGHYHFMIDGKLQFGEPQTWVIPRGEHRLNVKVWNQLSPPALLVDGPTVKTDSSWKATYEDKIWIDEEGVAHGSGLYVDAASWYFHHADTPPSHYRLLREDRRPEGSESLSDRATLYDFGRETFGYLKFLGLRGEGTLHIYYGESREEALDREHCETLDIAQVQANPSPLPSSIYPLLGSKAMRYVQIERSAWVEYDQLLLEYEYAPYDKASSGSFFCSDEELNKIWKVSAYTLDLTTREFFVDGIKRDRWTWSGDAIQSYLMNYYLRFDSECVKRTIRQLRGKDPVTAHVNTIMDYTFYWFKSIYDYYEYTGDITFVREMYPRMVTLMDYVLGRTDAHGFAEGKPDDWIFVDWVDFPMHKRGILCFEQILFWKSLETMERCARLSDDESGAEKYGRLARRLHDTTKDYFYSYDLCTYFHAIEDSHLNEQVTKFPNMFAILYDFADEEEKIQLLYEVLLNSEVEPITTPYMRFYELAALCECGEHATVLEEMKAYWGGMLREGATTFWEKYNPEERGTAHLAMYGRPYGKSLCHAWGASPLYLLGRYFLGVRPTQPGYAAYEVRPVWGDWEYMFGYVPTPWGRIQVIVWEDRVTVCVEGDHAGRGVLVLGDRRIDIPSAGVSVNLSDGSISTPLID